MHAIENFDESVWSLLSKDNYRVSSRHGIMTLVDQVQHRDGSLTYMAWNSGNLSFIHHENDF